MRIKNMISLDSIREEVSLWESMNLPVPEKCMKDVLTVLDVLESDPVDLIREYSRLKAILGYWKSSIGNFLDESITSENHKYSLGIKDMKGSISEKKALVYGNEEYRFAIKEKNKWKRIYNIFDALMNVLDTDILVQMSVNRRREDEVDNG